MKTLIIMRHAKTEEGKGNQKDFDRELIYKGLKDAALMALWIKKKYFKIDAIIASAALRTQHTATIVKEICGGSIDVLDSLYHADASEILNSVRQVHHNPDSLLVVGHNPALSNVVSFLSREIIELKPSDVMVFELHNQTWKEKLNVISSKHHSEY